MFTASAALQTKTTALTTKINDYGVMTLPGGRKSPMRPQVEGI